MRRTPIRIGLIGDFNPAVRAHQAIPIALRLAADFLGCKIEPVWLATAAVRDECLSTLNGHWCVPASPYVNMDGALHAIRFAREHHKPFLGTCGGFQHTLIEYARNVAGLHDADHAESNPSAATPLISPLNCSLVRATGSIRFLPGSRLAAIYGSNETTESYHCNFGLSPAYRSLFENGPLHVCAVDNAGDVRAVELDDHPFFFATLYQSELTALAGKVHPLIAAFVRAAANGGATVPVAAVSGFQH